jgi:hypothetical protein
MGSGCSVKILQSTSCTKALEARIDFAIQNLPPYIDCILDTARFGSRAEAIEDAMKDRGYRKITATEYSGALKNKDNVIYLWKRLNDQPGNRVPSDVSAELVDTEDLLLLIQNASSTSDSVRLSQVDTEEWPTPKGVVVSRACNCSECLRENFTSAGRSISTSSF